MTGQSRSNRRYLPYAAVADLVVVMRVGFAEAGKPCSAGFVVELSVWERGRGSAWSSHQGSHRRWRCWVSPVKLCQVNTYIFAFSIQSRSSSPSSDPPGPPRTCRNSFGCHSIPCSALFAVSSRCLSSTFDFSSVAAVWFDSLMAITVLSHSLCDSRSSCSSIGRTVGAVCFACDALKRTSL